MLAPKLGRCSVKRTLKSEWILVLVSGEEIDVENITAQRIGCKRKRTRIGYIEYACAKMRAL